MKYVGINGFGRIGRYFTRIALMAEDIDIRIINDLADIETCIHLLKYDSIHGRLPLSVEIEGNTAKFSNGKKIIFSQIAKPEMIDWSGLNVTHVLESTGLFRTKEMASKHLGGTVQKVIISAPAKDDSVPTVVVGVNDDNLNGTEELISNASCTTNSAAPLIKVMHDLCKIESAYITTVHSYTSDQRLQDAPHVDLRRARAAAESIVPTTTGAAKAIAKIFPDLEGHVGGCGIRVPVPDGSLTDLTLIVDTAPTIQEINEAMRKASENELKNILEYTEDPIVSRDILGNPHSCIFDSKLTSIIGNMVKIVGWYDNEAGYSNRLLDLIRKV